MRIDATVDGSDVCLAVDGVPSARLGFPPGTAVGAGGDVALVAGLFPAMAQGEPLAVGGSVDERLRSAAATAQDVLLTWDRDLHPSAPWYRRVGVTADHTHAGPSRADGRGTACFFTAGVDSLYSVLRHRTALDALVFVHGFDVPLDDHGARQRVSTGVQAAADALGLPLIEVVTDLRRLGEDHGVPWFDYHGAAMAAVAHALAPRFARVVVPTSLTYASLYSLGSHPLLDPLWSSADVEVVHDGLEQDRIGKLAAISDLPAARDHLRVCHANEDGAYNCGRCEKCLRTIVAIRLARVEGTFRTLPPLDRVAVARVFVPGAGASWRGFRRRLHATGEDRRLEAVITLALLRRDAGDLYRRAVRR
jgi:hypothetical protein